MNKIVVNGSVQEMTQWIKYITMDSESPMAGPRPLEFPGQKPRRIHR